METENQKEDAWLAVRTKPVWDENQQHRFSGTWPEIVAHAEKLATAHQREVRVSASKGFSNGGHYVWPRCGKIIS